MSLSLLTPSRTVLLISDEALYIYSTGMKGVSLLETVPWTADNFENHVANVLSKDCGGKSVVILNDMVEQHYRKERMRKKGVSVLDKSSMLTRKLNVSFPNYPIRAHLKLKEKVVKTDTQAAADVYIFAAVPASEAFSKTITAVKQSLVNIDAFSLLPVEAADMVKALSSKVKSNQGSRSRWTVFIGQHKGGGLRQIVTKDGEIALTRMTPVSEADDDASQWAKEIDQEFKATMSYLSRFGYNPNDGLDVIVIANPASGEALEGLLDAPGRVDVMTSIEAARLLNISIGRQEDLRYADSLHVAWSGRKKSFIMPMKSKLIDDISKPRRTALAASLLLFLTAAGLAYFAFDQYQASAVMQEDLQDMKQQKTQLDAQYNREVKRKEALGYDIRLIQSALAVDENLKKQRIDVLKLYSSVGRALGKDLRVDGILVEKLEQQVVSRMLRGGSQPSYQATMQITYPNTANVDKGNKEISDLHDRLSKLMPDHTVEVTKFLKDYEYVEEVVVETGSFNKKEDNQDFVSEIRVTGPEI